MGLGHVVVRDAISFLKYDRGDANPLRGVEKAYAWGRSQTGRCLRDFVYRGFNADAQGRRVFDGVLPHVAGAGTQMAEPSVRQPDRLRRAAIRRSFQHRRQLSVLLRLVARPSDRARGRDPQAAGRPIRW